VAARREGPAQKLVPRPVTTTQRSARSAAARATAARNADMTSGVMLLRFSGRFSVIVAIASATS
jgi:hypothetical protein